MSDLFHPYSWRIYYNDEVAEWLRRWTANPMGSARVGSNPGHGMQKQFFPHPVSNVFGAKR